MKAVMAISDQFNDIAKDNIILFPKTIEYYQVQLTRMLEMENYLEAIELLKFLLQCQGDDRRVFEEWKVLLEWLQTQFASLTGSEKTYELESEAELLSRHIQNKASQDQDYAKKLLDMLLHDETPEKKFIALDQLVYIEHPQIDETLKRWVETVDLHPLVQFKVLQTLKLREVNEDVTVNRNGELITVQVSDVPLTYEDYPEPIVQVMERVHQISEVNHPALGYFAEQTWKTFLSHIYGTNTYEHIAQQDSAGILIWAAALHYISIETMLGSIDVDETFEQYGLTPDAHFQWEQAYRLIKNFIDTAFRSN